MGDAITRDVVAIVIGRNEGERLKKCLRALDGQVSRIIYVDSGSDDGSIEFAQDMNVDLVRLDMSRPFTAARARNEGLSQINEGSPEQLVQFVDGDSEIVPGWITKASNFLVENTEVAGVAGRLRERHPDANIWHKLADREWNQPVGAAKATGGIAMYRLAPLRKVGGFDSSMIAGEEPELCLRLRQSGWKIWRLDAEMALHDISMTRFSQWWTRCRRAGYAFALGADKHRGEPEKYRQREVRRSVFWGGIIPFFGLAGAFLTPWALFILLSWPLQLLRLYLRERDWGFATFSVLGKMPEALGITEYVTRRIFDRRRTLIEYK